MYDPMIVDTFLQVHPNTPSEIPRQGPPSEVLIILPGCWRRPLRIDAVYLIRSQRMAMGTLTAYELAKALAGHMNLKYVVRSSRKHLQSVIPLSLCVFFLMIRASDYIVARHVVGDGGAQVHDLRIALGQRLSGWVAANRQTISNGRAALILGGGGRSIAQTRSCLSTPLILDDELIGVLTVYSGACASL